MSLIDFLPIDGESKAALKVLHKELGLFTALQMGIRLKKREKQGREEEVDVAGRLEG